MGAEAMASKPASNSHGSATAAGSNGGGGGGGGRGGSRGGGKKGQLPSGITVQVCSRHVKDLLAM